MFNKKNILITGGTGSFGKNFVKYLLKNYNPSKIIIYSRDEVKQFEMSLSLSPSRFSNLRYFIGDVRDRDRLDQALRGVDYVVHAAALKQVPAAEYNPIECIKTNINGAENVIQSSINNKVSKVIALSTDKAANPTGLYGASKLASDKLFISSNNFSGGVTKFSVVRYGNVIGSRGSVVPFFKKLISEGNKFLPITHPSMTRFWITINQGINLVSNSFKTMIGGEIFVPIIPSIRITDLAKAMAPNLKQKIIGIRPGEKIHEVMCTEDDTIWKFKDYYLIVPIDADKNKYRKNKLKEIGKHVSEKFEYSSGTNKTFLSISQIRKLNKYSNIKEGF